MGLVSTGVLTTSILLLGVVRLPILSQLICTHWSVMIVIFVMIYDVGTRIFFVRK